jgi:hypothetical protein
VLHGQLFKGNEMHDGRLTGEVAVWEGTRSLGKLLEFGVAADFRGGCKKFS